MVSGVGCADPVFALWVDRWKLRSSFQESRASLEQSVGRVERWKATTTTIRFDGQRQRRQQQ
jgi:hypothetical protein